MQCAQRAALHGNGYDARLIDHFHLASLLYLFYSESHAPAAKLMTNKMAARVIPGSARLFLMFVALVSVTETPQYYVEQF
jgi:hypothetical protein